MQCSPWLLLHNPHKEKTSEIICWHILPTSVAHWFRKEHVVGLFDWCCLCNDSTKANKLFNCRFKPRNAWLVHHLLGNFVLKSILKNRRDARFLSSSTLGQIPNANTHTHIYICHRNFEQTYLMGTICLLREWQLNMWQMTIKNSP